MIDQLTFLYLSFGVRWAFYGRGWLDVTLDFVALCAGFVACMTAVGWLFKSGEEHAELAHAELARTQPKRAHVRSSATCHVID